METKHKTIFATQIRAIEADEATRNEAKASISQLRNLLPANINPEDEPALLFVAGNLAVAGLVNLNDDGVDLETGIVMHKRFVNQQINIEHDRKRCVGFIIHAGLSEFGTDRVITEDEARAAGQPVNIAIVMALWRVVDRELCNYIEEASSPTHPDFNALSLSFEVGFDGYRVAALPKGSPNIADAKMVVKPDEAAFGRYDGALRANKGQGLSPDDGNLRVYRIIDEGVIPLGGGIVTVPAAAVHGLVAITEKPKETVVQDEQKAALTEEETRKAAAEQRTRDIASALEEAKKNANAVIALVEEKMSRFLNLSKTRVSSNTPINSSHMKLNSLQGLKLAIAKASKIEDLPEVAASIDPIIDAIMAESEKQEAARKAAEQQSAELAAAKAQIQAASEQLTKDLDIVRKELADLRAAQAAASAEEAFQGRMAAIDETFELSDDERAELVADVKGLTDEAFAKFMDKSKKLMKEKTKDFIKKKKDDDAKAVRASQDAIVAKLGERGVKAKVTDEGLFVEEVIASAQANQTSSAAGTMAQPENTGDLKTLATKALSTMSFGGKKK